VRLLADTNIVAPAVRALRQDGHDVIYSAERNIDPGDAALLAEANDDRRIFLTKDHDIGALVFRDGAQHAGVLLIDDLASVVEETRLLRHCLQSHASELAAGAFVRANADGAHVAKS
jgi:predicted nuclease of predicted toxin-antitoxin system